MNITIIGSDCKAPILTHRKEVIKYLVCAYDFIVQLVIARRVGEEHVAIRDENVEDVNDLRSELEDVVVGHQVALVCRQELQ